MDRTCSISGEVLPESEGLYWNQLRPSLQNFLKTLKTDWKEDYFISYSSLNELLRAYIANLTAEEIKANHLLEKKVRKHFAKEESLKPLEPFKEDDEISTVGTRMADRIADFGGSWTFIGIFLGLMLIWMTMNVIFLSNKGFDPYPFILLNLVLSCLAAIQAPVIMMSQNRQESKDRRRAEYDFRVNLKAETEVRLLHEKVDHLLLHQHQNMLELFQLQLDIMQQIQNRTEALMKNQKQKEN